MARLTLMTFLAVLCLLVAVPGTARAERVADFVVFDGTTVNEAKDEDYEYLVKGDNNSATGIIEIGDIIRGAVSITAISPSPGLPDGNQSKGVIWTAVFSIRVRDIVNGSDPNGVGFDTQGDIIFEPDPDFQAFLDTLTPPGGSLGSADGPDLGASNRRVMIRMWESDNTNYPDQLAGATTTSAISTYALGDFYWDLGFADPDEASHADAGGVDGITSDNGEGWVARNGGLVFSALSGLTPNSTIGTGNFALSRINGGIGSYFLIQNPIGLIHEHDLGAASGATAQLSGFSTVKPAGSSELAQGFDAQSDSTLIFVAAVPLPGAVWPGLFMLLGVGAIRIRGRRKAA